MTTTEAAALWWAERFALDEKREAFHESLLLHLARAGPVEVSARQANQSPLYPAVKQVCDGDAPAEVGLLFPPHAAMRLRDGLVWVREEKDAEWQVLRW